MNLKIYTKFILAVIMLTVGSVSHAKIEVPSPINLQIGLSNWTNEFGTHIEGLKKIGLYPIEGYAECREITELQSVFLCLYPDRLEMNHAFGRASFYIEGNVGYPRGQIVRLDNPLLVADNEKILGHDLQGSDLLNYMKASEKACVESKDDSNICYSIHESDLIHNFIESRAVNDPDLVVIAAPLDPDNEFNATISHEVSHAQYFRDAVYQQTIHNFWTNQVLESDKKKILEILLADGYDTEDKVLVENEFQAYMLESSYMTSRYSVYSIKYRKLLVESLKAAGIIPLAINI